MHDRQGAGERELEELLRKRRQGNPRHTPGRNPLGAEQTRRALVLTAVALGLATALLGLLFVLRAGAGG